MVRIRLRRVGGKKQPSFRIVAADKESPRDGRFLENLGYYNPRTEPATLRMKEDRIYDWISKGAQPSDSVKKLFNSAGLMDRYERFKAGESIEVLMEEAAAAEVERGGSLKTTGTTPIKKSKPEVKEEQKPEPEKESTAVPEAKQETAAEVEEESPEEPEAEAEPAVESEEEADEEPAAEETAEEEVAEEPEAEVETAVVAEEETAEEPAADSDSDEEEAPAEVEGESEAEDKVEESEEANEPQTEAEAESGEESETED